MELIKRTHVMNSYGPYATVREAKGILAQMKPEVVLLDLDLGKQNGIEQIPSIFSCYSGTKPEILVLTASEEIETVFQALEAGATGYLIKSCEPGQIIDAIRDIADGGAPMSPGIARRVVRKFNERGALRKNLAELTPRERQILDLIATGMSNQEIATELGIAEKGVRNHAHNIYQKLHLDSRSQLIATYGGLM